MSIQLGSLVIGLPQEITLSYWLPLSIVLLGALIVSSYLLYVRLANKDNITRSLLLGLNTLAFVALLGLILEVKIGRVQLKSATLITANMSGAQLAAMPQLADEKTVWYLAEPPAASAKQTDKQPTLGNVVSNAIEVNSVAQIAQLQPDLQQLNVIGDGLTSAQWRQLFASNPAWGTASASKLGISFSPSPKLSGPINLHWQKQLILGESLVITGELQTALAPTGKVELYRLALVDPVGETIEHLELAAQQQFSFNVTPKTLGTWRYQLKMFSLETDTLITTEPVAVHISYPPPQSIAIWQSAPSFETRHLKDWAAHFGSQLTVVSQISQDKFISQRLNGQARLGTQVQPPLTAEAFFTKQHLHTYDLLLIDGRGLVDLANTARIQLAEAVNQGLGLLILADGDLLEDGNTSLNELAQGISLTPRPAGAAYVPTSAQWQEISTTAPISWFPAELSVEHAEVLVKGDTKQALVVNAPQGMGQVAVTLVKASYNWQTTGDAQLYSQYWQHLIQQIARNRTGSYWQTEPDNRVVYSGQSQQICARSAAPQNLTAAKKRLNAAVSQFASDAQLIPLRLQTSSINDANQCAYYWAAKPGWQRFSLTRVDDTTSINVEEQARYVYPPSAWRAWQQASKQHLSELVANHAIRAQAKFSYSAVNKLYFFLTLIFALTLLWIARKWWGSAP